MTIEDHDNADAHLNHDNAGARLNHDNADAHLIDLLPYRRLDAYRVALEALALADEVASALPRGYGPLADQLRRASQSVLLQLGEGSARFGADQRNRFVGACAEAVEGAIATEGILRLKLVNAVKLRRLLTLFARLHAILGGLARR